MSKISKTERKLLHYTGKAIADYKPSQLLDHKLWDFKNLEKTLEMI